MSRYLLLRCYQSTRKTVNRASHLNSQRKKGKKQTELGCLGDEGEDVLSSSCKDKNEVKGEEERIKKAGKVKIKREKTSPAGEERTTGFWDNSCEVECQRKPTTQFEGPGRTGGLCAPGQDQMPGTKVHDSKKLG